MRVSDYQSPDTSNSLLYSYCEYCYAEWDGCECEEEEEGECVFSTEEEEEEYYEV